ncbi:MAG: glycosyltransferase family 2 protein [Verrucomicrobia bacterium]|nr:glycosyltransferase family 2 protein [Verrucomicrobiota bacterium]
MKPELSIVVPVYNEVESVDALCAQIDAALSKVGRTHELILVDDGSTDGTWEKFGALVKKYPYLRVLRFRGNFGQTAAMSAGFHAAQGDVVITLDADLQNDPADIPLLLAKMAEGYDVVSGWRKDRQDPFINRRLPSMLANGMISRSTGVPLHDYGCTLKAYKRDVIQDVHLYGEMHRFIPALCSWVGARVGEVPVNHRARQFGTSKYGISRTFRVVLDLMTVKFLLRYSTRPIQIFGRIGFGFGGLALLMLSAIVVDRIFGIADPFLLKRPFWVITPLMLLGFALQIVSVGLLAEIQIRTWHESQKKSIYVIKETLPPSDV